MSGDRGGREGQMEKGKKKEGEERESDTERKFFFFNKAFKIQVGYLVFFT